MTTRTRDTRTTDTSIRGPVLASLYTGLILTVLSVAFVFVDRASSGLLAAHLKESYPSYGPTRIEEAVTLWTTVLTIVGALSVVGWILAIWATRRGFRWAGWLMATLFAVGTALGLYLLTVRDTSGDTGLPTELGVIGLLPSAAGLAAVLLTWRSRKSVTRGMPA